MSGIDMTQRKLKIPPKFLPYLERHRIFELLYELGQFLIEEKPKDHISYMKKMLPCAAKSRDSPKIVFMAPPDFDRVEFAQQIADELGIVAISKKDFTVLKKPSTEELSCCTEEESPRMSVFPEWYLPEENSSLGLFHSEEDFRTETSQRSFVEIFKKSSTLLDANEEAEKKAVYAGIRVCPCKKTEQDLSGQKEEEDKQEKSYKEEHEGEGAFKIPMQEEEREIEVEKEKETEKQGGTATEEEETQKLVKKEKKKKEERLLFGCKDKGWILVDFPSNGEEAKRLCTLGVFPTHALKIVTENSAFQINRKHKWNVATWSTVYKSVPVTEIFQGKRTLDELVGDLRKILERMPHRHPPMLPRIVLIGSRGSGTSTQADKLRKKYRFVHVDFEEVLRQAIERRDEFGQNYLQQSTTEVDPEVEAAILEVNFRHFEKFLRTGLGSKGNYLQKALTSTTCLKRGWILTGYPKNLHQMRMLDLTVTPPNRVIFLELPPKECFIRLYYRQTDECTGQVYKIPDVEPSGLDHQNVLLDFEVKSRLRRHPRDDERQIISDIEDYFAEKQPMIDYCGKSAFIVDGNKSIDGVFELIDQIIINSAAAAPPRKPLAASEDILNAFHRLNKLRADEISLSSRSTD